MSWSDLVQDLDASVFAELADDPAGQWSREGVFSVTLAIILDQVERRTSNRGLALIDRADVARISVAEVARLAPGQAPQQGDVLTVAGVQKVIRGACWLDEDVNGRDWLCPVN